MMTLRKICIIGVLLSVMQSGFAQTRDLSLEKAGGIAHRFSKISIAYYGENLIHPGFRLGGSLLLSEKEKVKKYLLSSMGDKKGRKVKIIQYLLDANAGLYNHPNNHLGIVTGVGITRMVTRTKRGFTTSLSLEANYLRRAYNIPTFEINENGELEELRGAGNNALQISFAPAMGKLLKLKGDKTLHLYMKQHIQFLNYDFGIFPNGTSEIGLSYSL